MLLPIHDRSRARQLLSGLVLLALCSNTSAWVFCPYASGSSHRCFTRNSISQSDNVADPSRDHMHHAGMDMSEMANSDMSMDRADVDITSDSASHLDHHDSLNVPFSNAAGLELVRDELIAQPIESCSHCMMHSQSQANSAFRTVAISTSSSDVTDSAFTMVNALAAVSSCVEVHDHGPPGSIIPRYVLVGAFRI
jgi:hypothetical protein